MRELLEICAGIGQDFGKDAASKVLASMVRNSCSAAVWMAKELVTPLLSDLTET